MYGNPIPNPTAGAAKAIVIFLLFIIVGSAILTLAASGNFGPEAVARAGRIETQTQIEKEKELAALQYQRAVQQQKLEQAAREFEVLLVLKEWVVRLLTIGTVLAMIIIAVGKSVQWVYQARDVKQVAHLEQALPAASMETSASMQVHERLKEMEKQIAHLQLQVLALQQQLERMRTHGGNGSDPGDKIIPFKSVVG